MLAAAANFEHRHTAAARASVRTLKVDVKLFSVDDILYERARPALQRRAYEMANVSARRRRDDKRTSARAFASATAAIAAAAYNDAPLARDRRRAIAEGDDETSLVRRGQHAHSRARAHRASAVAAAVAVAAAAAR